MHLATLLRPSLIFVAAMTLSAPLAAAGVPSPANSSLPDCIHTALDGTLITIIVVRDIANNPVGSSTVQIAYGDCAEFSPCPTLVGVDSYTLDTVNKTFNAVTDNTGKIVVYLRGGGGCVTHPFRILADGVLLGTRREASDDQNGDHVVDFTDVGLIQGKVGTADLTGDLDCNGAVDVNDVSFVQGRVNTVCEGPVPTLPTSWGRVKILYR